MIPPQILGTLAGRDLEHLIIQITIIYMWWEREKEITMDEHPQLSLYMYPKRETQSYSFPE